MVSHPELHPSNKRCVLATTNFGLLPQADKGLFDKVKQLVQIQLAISEAFIAALAEVVACAMILSVCPVLDFISSN